MPEGDTLARTAAGLRPYLNGRVVNAARAQGPGPVPQVHRLIGQRIDGVDAQGKNLLIRFDGGLELRTHLRMHGSWHRYRPGERWRRPPARARLVLEVDGSVAVCFDAPVVELFEQRTEAAPPVALDARPGPGQAGLRSGRGLPPAAPPRSRRDRDRASPCSTSGPWPASATCTRARSCGSSSVSPFVLVRDLDDATLERLIATARRLMLENIASTSGPERVTTRGDRGAPGPVYVYSRGGRPCRRCTTPIASREQGQDLPRLTYWCPTCQEGARS